MKYPITCFLLLIHCLVYSQSTVKPVPSTSKTSLANFQTVTLRIDPHNAPPAGAAHTPFSHFEVIDERPDTSRIGLHSGWGAFNNTRDRQMIFTIPAAIELAGYLNTHFATPGAPYTALIVLRTLWLSDANYVREDLIKDPNKALDKNHIRLKAEIYATRDSLYTPVIRFDTLQTTPRKDYSLTSVYSVWEDELGDMINEMADSSALVLSRKTTGGRLIGREDIRQFNQSRFAPPILTGTVMNPGVYASFEEFKDNAPSIPDYEIKKEKKSLLLYIKDAHGMYYTHSAWGLCDGKDIYIMKEGVLCLAWKEGNSFYFYGTSDKEFTSPPGLFAIGKPGVAGTPPTPPQLTGPWDNIGTPDPQGPGGSTLPNGSNTQIGTQKVQRTYRRVYVIDMDKGSMY